MILNKSGEIELNDRHREAIDRFHILNGRKIRVLAIGNIANNAFKNALILRRSGVDCDVLCYDYYHVMGCPEWECAEFSTTGLDFDRPVWRDLDLGGYERPRWFVQGHLSTCLSYLQAYCTGDAAQDALWTKLQDEINAEANAAPDVPLASDWGQPAALRRLAYLFASYFPDRASDYSTEALELGYSGFLLLARKWRSVFAHYDAVIGYATDGLYPLLFHKRPYICFEHGTIRTFPFERTALGQVCAVTYAHANDVLITNCDNIVAAQKLGLRSYRFVPHALIEEVPADAGASLRADLLERYDADFIVFHPSRQHWSDERNLNWEKGNDVLIKGFAAFLQNHRPKALLIMVAWGQTVESSKALVASLDIADRVVWIEPQTVLVVGRYICASDALADQFMIGAWGAIMPHGLMLGCPTLMYLDEAVHRWCFPEMPPVLNVRTPQGVESALASLLDAATAGRFRAEGPLWYQRYHSESVVRARLLDSLFTSLEPSPDRRNEILLREIDARVQQAQMRASVFSSFKTSLQLGMRNSVESIALRLHGLKSRFPILGGAAYGLARGAYRLAGALRRLR